MPWQFVVALAIAVPIVLFPAAFVWFFNIGGIYDTIKEARDKQTASRGSAKVTMEAK